MKSTLFHGLLAVLSSAVLVQAGDTDKQLGPFYLQLQSNDSSVNGRYLSTCHTGAAMSTLCVGNITKPAFSGPQFYFNYTGAVTDLGQLTWNLPLSGGGGSIVRNVSLPLSLGTLVGSNVAATSFSPGSSPPTYVGFRNDVLYLPSFVDDSKFVEGVYPGVQVMQELSHWHACYVMVGSYYYQALAWVTSGVPNNPTCKPVEVIRVN